MRHAADDLTDSRDAESLHAFAATTGVFRRYGKAFQFPAVFLPREKRLAAGAVFAFVRITCELIDVEEAQSGASSCSPTSLDGRMQIYRDRVEEMYSARFELPPGQERSEAQHVMYAMMRVIRRYEIPQCNLLDLAEGRRTEVAVKRYPTWARVEKMLQLRAGSVGKILSAVLGVQSSQAGELAEKYSTAMGLVSLLLNIKQDYARRQIRLPLEDLARFGYSERDLAAGVINDAFAALMQFEIDRARSVLREGAEALAWLADDGSRMAAAMAGVQFAAKLDAIRAGGFDVFTREPRVSLARRSTNLLRAWKLAKRFAGEPVPDVF